ncbi:MAG TPA: hypothetical protein VGD54_06280 [Steroidobacteraceae bacterium]
MSTSKRRILVTGASGKIRGHVLETLANREVAIRAFLRKASAKDLPRDMEVILPAKANLRKVASAGS